MTTEPRGSLSVSVWWELRVDSPAEQEPSGPRTLSARPLASPGTGFLQTIDFRPCPGAEANFVCDGSSPDPETRARGQKQVHTLCLAGRPPHLGLTYQKGGGDPGIRICRGWSCERTQPSPERCGAGTQAGSCPASAPQHQRRPSPRGDGTKGAEPPANGRGRPVTHGQESDVEW